MALLKERKKCLGPECPECEGHNVLYSKTTGKFTCRRCGAEWEKKGAKNGNKGA